ncbi:MAG: Ldh family oxidoreductase [Candidatus Latescibacteria bacterium]|nr:Ldh family oxidoreductase [Candidatus Latescibacterota bacterium]
MNSSTSHLTSDPSVLRIDAARLTDFCIRALTTVGMTEMDARITASILVRTDMRGISTHGTVSLRRYVHLMRDGGMNPRAVPQIIAEGPAWAQMDAHQAVGMVAGHAGMTVAITKAKMSGIGFVGVRRSNHFGAASAYSLMALDHEMIGVAMSNTDAVMNIPGGRGAVIGNNPLSYAVPARTYPAMVLDIAMSTVAGGKIASLKQQGKPVPLGWLTDCDGLPTTDPSVFPVDGALTPVGGQKGYGLALLVETLAGVLTGAGVTTDIISWAKDSHAMCNEGHAFLAIDVKAMMPLETFYGWIDELIGRMKTAPKAKGAERTYVPGEMEFESEQVARQRGVALTEMAVNNLRGLADDLGVRASLPF